ncbi:MAG: Efflux pump, RND family, membrane fusion lipoprotein [Candidatus Moranbacteria bacterium GW2011_GWC2_37_8]|nr:MAG: Efflux pump, RND family, membrane fusion lipoprotein [Candidatus Moranbacteria bacterium GW2011_GWC2_37_8]KKQ62864.1 MAG: RND family efflux transporter MFP subunit [Parcubacteria group bacterium GW2011_GWC1_38_22]
MKKKSWLKLIGPLIVIIIILAIILSLKSTSNAEQSKVVPTVKITRAKIAESTIPIEISGFVRGENRADIAPMASGKILNILKHEGEQVKKGEVLAIIEANQSDTQIAAANASVAAIKKTLTETKNYYDQLVDQAKESADEEAIESAKRGRDLQIQGAETQLTSAEGALSIARSGKNNFILVAPFSGIITAIHSRVGGFANFSSPLISIHTQNNLEIETYVSASNGHRITNGAIVSLQSPSGIPLSGIVTTVAPGVDSLSLKTLVRIHLNDETSSVHLGDFLHGEILTPRQQPSITIPRNSVVSRGGDSVVFTLDENNIAKEQLIKIANENGNSIEVSEGIAAHQKIVTQGQQYLINGSLATPYETN